MGLIAAEANSILALACHAEDWLDRYELGAVNSIARAVFEPYFGLLALKNIKPQFKKNNWRGLLVFPG